MNDTSIVLVDDDEDKRFLLTRFLKKRFPENQISALPSCKEAMPVVEAPGRKIVVTNGKVISEDGIEFAAFISHQLHVPVVMISLRSELKSKAQAAGVVAFVETGDDEGIQDAVIRALERIDGPYGLRVKEPRPAG